MPARSRPPSICSSDNSTRCSATSARWRLSSRSREGECCRILGTAPDTPAYSRQFYGVGLRKEDAELKNRFDQALAAVQADGTYERIRAKYFDFDIK